MRNSVFRWACEAAETINRGPFSSFATLETQVVSNLRSNLLTDSNASQMLFDSHFNAFD